MVHSIQFEIKEMLLLQKLFYKCFVNYFTNNWGGKTALHKDSEVKVKKDSTNDHRISRAPVLQLRWQRNVTFCSTGNNKVK